MRRVVVPAALGLALGVSPALADHFKPIVVQVSQLIRGESCSDCTAIEIPAQSVKPAKHKIKVTEYWYRGSALSPGVAPSGAA